MIKNEESVSGLFDCPRLGYRVTPAECTRFYESDAGCPRDCEARAAHLGSGAGTDRPGADLYFVGELDGKSVYRKLVSQKRGGYLLFSAGGENIGRICSLCKQPKLWEEYGKKKNGACGYNSWCRECTADKRSEFYYEVKKEVGTSGSAEYEPANPDHEVPAGGPGERPSSEQVLEAIKEGTYQAVIDVVASAFERVADNIRQAPAGGNRED